MRYRYSHIRNIVVTQRIIALPEHDDVYLGLELLDDTTDGKKKCGNNRHRHSAEDDSDDVMNSPILAVTGIGKNYENENIERKK